LPPVLSCPLATSSIINTTRYCHPHPRLVLAASFVPLLYTHGTQLDDKHVSRRRHYALRHRLRPRHTRSRPCLRVRTVCLPTPRPSPIATAASSSIIAPDPASSVFSLRHGRRNHCFATQLPPFLLHPCAPTTICTFRPSTMRSFESNHLTPLKLWPPSPLRHPSPPFGFL
jgi:hypothetical protein